MRARTHRIPDPGPLLPYADPRDPRAVIRRGDGVVGRGRALRLETRGASRFSDARSWWEELVESAEIHDEVGLPGTGLVAFGAFAFSEHSTATSVLEVPELIVGRRDGIAWATEIHVVDDPVAAGEPASATIVPAAVVPTTGSPAAGSPAAGSPAAGSPATASPATASPAAGSHLSPPVPGAPQPRTPNPDTPHFRLPSPIPAGPPAQSVLTEGAMDRIRHRAAVSAALARLRAGDLAKVVLARDAHGRIAADADRRHILERLAAAYPETWTFAVDGLTGASPEMLVRVLGGQLAARVLAGTMPRGADAAADAAARDSLRDSEKNRIEHRLAIESALASLGALTHDSVHRGDDVGAGLTTSPEPFLLALPNVWHLASDIRGALPATSSVLSLVEALHPTAAVGGTPRDAAMRLIDDLEPFDRQRYAGPAGWVSAAGDGEWVVALRSAEIAPDGAVTAFAGGGIVAASDPIDEFAETLPKLAPIVNALRPDEN